MPTPSSCVITLLGTAFCGVILSFSPAQTRPAVPPKSTPPGRLAVLKANDAAINALLKKLTLEEKIKMVHANSAFASGGIPRLGIPELMTSDGPHGVRPE